MVRPSCRCRVGLQSAAGSRPGRAVGQGAGRSSRAVGLRGFASPDVSKYCLAVFGIPVSNYSDSSPQASGQLGKVGRRFFSRVFMEMIMPKTKLVHADMSNDCFLALQVLCGGCRLGFVRAPFHLFHVPSALWLVLSLAGQPLCGLWLRVGRGVECTILRLWERI